MDSPASVSRLNSTMSATRAGLLKAMRHRTMSPSSTPLSFLGSSCIAQKRYASHGEHFNEPSGLLFGELVRYGSTEDFSYHILAQSYSYVCISPERTGQNVREKTGSSSGTGAWEEVLF